MKSIIESFVELGNGLNIIDAPTGFGKTFSINEYILNYKGNKNIFFITNQIKNLNYNSLKDLFQKHDKLNFFYDNVLLLDAIYKNVMKINEVKIIQQEIIDSKEYVELSKICKSFSKVELDLRNYLEENIKNELEPKFRQFLKKYFEVKKIYTIHDLSAEYDWLKDLYPILHVDQRKIFIMTTKKFVMPQDSLLGNSYYFYNSDYIKDSIIFIDEFDSAKKDILSALIAQGTNYGVDVFSLFNRVYYFLAHNKIPNNLMKPGIYYDKEENKAYIPENLITNYLEYSSKLINECFLDYSFKMYKSNDTRNFIFKDKQMISINDSKETMKYELIETVQCNIIYLKSKKPLKTLEEAVNRTKYNLKILIDILTKVSENYFQTYNNEKNNLYKITFDESIYTVLNQVNVGNEYFKFLYNSIIKLHNFGKKYRQLNEENLFTNDYDFYLDGINIFELIDNNEHNEKTIIKNYAIEDTPERILLKMAKTCCIIGVSATGSIETNLANFDLNYLKNRLESQFRLLNKEQMDEIIKIYEKRNDEYDEKSIEIQTDIILNTDEFISEYSFLKIIDFLPYKDKILNIFESKDKGYYRNLLAKISVILFKFFNDKTINSFVSFLNFNITNKSNINQEEVNALFEITKDYFNISQAKIYYLKSYNYEQEYEKMQFDLKNGKKVICFTTYVTMSSGQNIQYEIPTNFSNYVRLNGYESKYKDFDGIYLHYPTFIMGQINIESNIEQIIFLLFELEYLKQGNAFENDEEFRKYVRAAFGTRKPLSKDLKQNINLQNSSLIKFIQAVGRICRTNNKNKKILLIADEEVIRHIQKSKQILKNKVLNKEILALINKEIPIERKIKKDELKKHRENYGSFKNKYIYKWSWTKEKILEWKKIRKYLLANPTLDQLPTNNLFLIHYIELENEDNRLFIDFKNNYIINISPEDSFLDRMLLVEGFKEYCVEKNIEINWKKGKYIMGNSSFGSIYKGALGEEFIKFILKQQCNIDLEELTGDEFECFDYKYKDVYFDFKNWNHRFEKNEEKSLKNIYNKINKTNAKKIFIVNSIKQGNYKSLETNDEKIEVINYIYDPKKNELNFEALSKILKSI